LSLFQELAQRAKKLNDLIQEQVQLIKGQEETIKENQRRLEQQEDVNKLVAEKFILEEDLTPKQRETLLGQFSEWEPNTSYEVDDIVKHDNELYQVIQEHTAQNGWEPPKVPALFNPYQPDSIENEDGEETEIIPDFEQPTASNPYMKGDKVRFNGSIYESTIDNNVWQPTAYPQGWTKL